MQGQSSELGKGMVVMYVRPAAGGYVEAMGRLGVVGSQCRLPC